MSQPLSPFVPEKDSCPVDWAIDGLDREARNQVLSQMFLEIYSQVLKKLSMINRDDLIKRSHKNQDLSSLYFYFDTNQSDGRGNQRCKLTKKEISQKISKLQGKTKLRYAHSSTDYIVVEDEFFKSSSVFGNKNQRSKILKLLSSEA